MPEWTAKADASPRTQMRLCRDRLKLTMLPRVPLRHIAGRPRGATYSDAAAPRQTQTDNDARDTLSA